MASPPFTEIFSNPHLFIDVSAFEEKQRVFEFLNKKMKKINSKRYETGGSFEKLEETICNISLLKSSNSHSIQMQDNVDHTKVQKNTARTHNSNLSLSQQNKLTEKKGSGLQFTSNLLKNHEDDLRLKKETSQGIVGEQRLQESYGDSPGPSAATKKQGEEQETCPICLDILKMPNMKTLPSCHHSFCKDCLKMAFVSKPVCPVCGIVYGRLKGNQPVNASMDVSTMSTPLPGNEKYGTIIIRYYVPSGIQGEEHPSPGHSYEGVSRIAFLPDSPEGRKVLGLLKRAFEQRLIFTVGQSSTTGRRNVVTWNDIHHKTSREGGPTNFGYPDAGYLSRVQEELKAKGIN
ncbi:probable E3 ubiquitin-protein ligase DTX3 isoform X2 [Paramormyrops kingsleyae]|uniref:E3 ubiquitin-protein ligase n=1 Tax=Paramormyrops kingsleyae TaxID=1676925 RepID=A0A3B3S1P5_9TELE|nr:probable E3 ubiquitin-protein ligase DTX3 isoform X2 [Paramormyrops kingsleyae]